MTNDNHVHVIQYHKHTARYKRVRDELAFNASESDDAPDEQILLVWNCNAIDNPVHSILYHKFNPMSNSVREELIFKASDNEDAPVEPT